MAVDVHAHMVPGALIDEMKRHHRAWTEIEMEVNEAGARFRFPGEPWTRPVARGLLDLEARTGWMGSHGIDEQWTAGWTDLMGYGLSDDVGAAWSRLLNDTMAAAIDGQPGLVGMASVPLQNPDLAAEELTRAVSQLGFAGAMIATQIAGRELDDSVLEPFWARAEALGAPVILHPGYTGNEPRLQDYGLINGVGRSSETMLAVSRLLMAGVLVRHPALRLILVHGGGYLPYQLGRLRHAYGLHHGAAGVADLDTQLSHLYYDSLVFVPASLEFLVRVAGSDHILVGSDYPFPIGDLDPVRVVHAADLAASDRDAILQGNAARLKASLQR